MSAAIVLFTRDLRVHDNPALDAACASAEHVVPLFVLDDELLRRFGAPNRVAFLFESLRDLEGSFRARGGGLIVRRGDVVAETVRCARETDSRVVFLAEDVSSYSSRREQLLTQAGLDVRVSPGVTVVPPGRIVPSGGGDHFSVFTAYWNRWRAETRRQVLKSPPSLRLPHALELGSARELEESPEARTSSALPPGGEAEGRRRLSSWLESGLGSYSESRDDLAADATSRLSPYLHFGCISPLEVVESAAARASSEEFVRQLCWRDFTHQLLAARPEIARQDLRPRGDRWRDDELDFEAWKDGRTGYPIVDAGMRQLRAEGFMHNRARLVTASFLTKHLYLDWRLGADHFASLLVDGDLANNTVNWQWVAGTGADSRPNRMFNPTRQALRYDPSGAYVRRYVSELGDIEGGAVHEPWRLGMLRPAVYPEPIVDHEEAVLRFRTARGVSRR